MARDELGMDLEVSVYAESKIIVVAGEDGEVSLGFGGPLVRLKVTMDLEDVERLYDLLTTVLAAEKDEFVRSGDRA
ncbi:MULTISPECIES: hypothetical protein [unclassified Crossiella]|uniref:hypothetical protein n=1 Tax=unclassified Crossiella TaxID=2620835 RepID=UPI001FFFDAD6|nr:MULTISPECIES: hypothetical protein [unclassified Crossiella]MCK2237825.1 hypothetical protein [Crossiella sp. S99.2]MCK2255111.1 hypothetical protein [Crossiella sp. S99.1]